MEQLKQNITMILDLLNKVEGKVEKIDETVDTVKDDMKKIELNVSRNSNSLEHHMQRTSLNEENIKLLRSYIDDQNAMLHQDVKPIKKWFDGFSFMAKIFGYICASLTFLVGVVQGLKHFVEFIK